MGAYSRFLRKILSVKMRNLCRNPVYEVSARRELSVSGGKRSPIFILLNYFCAIALWKLWKKKLTACWASLGAKNYLWKTCGKAGAVDRPSVLVQKLF